MALCKRAAGVDAGDQQRLASQAHPSPCRDKGCLARLLLSFSFILRLIPHSNQVFFSGPMFLSFLLA